MYQERNAEQVEADEEDRRKETEHQVGGGAASVLGEIFELALWAAMALAGKVEYAQWAVTARAAVAHGWLPADAACSAGSRALTVGFRRSFGRLWLNLAVRMMVKIIGAHE
jgi:hypothetical protein